MCTPRTLLHHLPRRKLPLPRLNGRAYTTPAPPPALTPISLSLRTSMRSLPHPVIILTTGSANSTPSSGGGSGDSTGVGITLSTLTCLSLSPHPLISFNIKTPSRTSSAIHAHPSGAFTVHVLSSTAHAAFVANAFAQVAAAPGEKADPWRNLRGGVLRDGETGVPELGAEDGVVARWRCRKYRVVQVEDHEIWVGRVVDVQVLGEGEVALGYADRRFRGGGEVVVPEFGREGDVIKVGEEEEAS